MAKKSTKQPKSLKERYRLRLGLVIAANVIVLVAFLTLPAVDFSGLKTVANQAKDFWKNLGSAALGTVIVTILNGVIPSLWKARLVFWRWHHPLPGSRAVVHLRSDSRIDLDKVEQRFGKFPSEPGEQNAAWYRIYREVQHEPAVDTTHEDFLFTRDCVALSALFLVFFGSYAIYALPSGPSLWTYLVGIAAEYLITTIAARNYGNRLVTTAVAVAQKPF